MISYYLQKLLLKQLFISIRIFRLSLEGIPIPVIFWDKIEVNS